MQILREGAMGCPNAVVGGRLEQRHWIGLRDRFVSGKGRRYLIGSGLSLISWVHSGVLIFFRSFSSSFLYLSFYPFVYLDIYLSRCFFHFLYLFISLLSLSLSHMSSFFSLSYFKLTLTFLYIFGEEF